MSAIIVIIHVIVCIALILIVLLQTGKGADMGMVFGGGGSQTLFGATGASTFLGKATTVVAVIFMLTSFSLAYMWGHRTGDSIMSDTEPPVQVQTPAEQNKQATDEAPKASEDASSKMTEQAPMPTEEQKQEAPPVESVEKTNIPSESAAPSAATPESSPVTN